jgi:Zn-finger nucleic acid-binding protein
MICPRCNTAMEAREHDGIKSGVCPQCSGIWIGGAALARLFERDQDAPHIEEALEAMLGVDYRSSRRHCPQCRSRYLKAVLIDDVELDYCVACKGLYFDQGELELVFPGTFGETGSSASAEPSVSSQFWNVILKFTGGRG